MTIFVAAFTFTNLKKLRISIELDIERNRTRYTLSSLLGLRYAHHLATKLSDYFAIPHLFTYYTSDQLQFKNIARYLNSLFQKTKFRAKK